MSIKKVLPVLIGLSLVPIAINSLTKSSVSDWEKNYNVRDTHVYNQGIINTMASLVVYLYNDPSEKHFNDRLGKLLNTPAKYKMPNDAQQALKNIYKTAYIESVKKSMNNAKQQKKPSNALSAGPGDTSPIDIKTWRATLRAYYKPLYEALDTNHRRINFGPREGEQLQPTLNK